MHKVNLWSAFNEKGKEIYILNFQLQPAGIDTIFKYYQ